MGGGGVQSFSSRVSSPTDQKTVTAFFFFFCFCLISQTYFKEDGQSFFQGKLIFQAGSPSLSRRRVQMLGPTITYITCDFTGGRGLDPHSHSVTAHEIRL